MYVNRLTCSVSGGKVQLSNEADKKFICGRVNSLRKTAGTLVERVRIKTGDFISKTIIGGRKI